MEINEKYFTRCKSKETRPGCWNVLDVDVFQKNEDGTETKIGEYERNYSSFYNTFFPFTKGGKEYALYSKSYTTTSVMSLPDCKHVADDDKRSFCPVDFFVPDFSGHLEHREWLKKRLQEDTEKKDDHGIKYWSNAIKSNEKNEKWIDKFALVSGCVWGDDSGGWKVNLLDISELESGTIKILPNLGYLELPVNYSKLSEIVSWEEPDSFDIGVRLNFEFNDDLEKSGFHGWTLAPLKMYSAEDAWKLYEIKEIDKKNGGEG